MRQTIAEMAQKLNQSDPQDGFAKLVKFLFNDFYKNYKYSNVPYSKEYMYNISYFTIYKFINREIVTDDRINDYDKIFRTKLLNYLVSMNYDADFNKLQADLKSSTVDMTRTATTDRTRNNTNTANRTNVNNQTGTITGSSTSDNTGSSTGKTTHNGTNENTHSDNANQINTDYPQSLVNALDTERYASGGGKANSSGTSNTTVSDTTDTTASSTDKNTSSSSSETTGKSELKMTGTITDAETENVSNNETWNNMSAYELNERQLEMYSKYDSFYKRLEAKFERCFMAQFVDEERDYYLDPTLDLFKYWED